MEKYEFKIGNDNGNSEQDIVINGDIIKSPSVHSRIMQLPNLEEIKEEYVAKNIHENLIVTIESDSLNQGAAATYYVGKYASKAGKMLTNIKIGAINDKVQSDIPVVNTLAHIAGHAVYLAYEENKNIKDEIEVSVDMTTGLPVNQYNQKNVTDFINRFVGKKHRVVVHLGITKVTVNIIFDFVKVLPEGIPTVFYLQSLKNNKEEANAILKSFNEQYTFSEKNQFDFNQKKILHVSIGEGTTEYPLTEGIEYNPNFIQGSNNGAGHAINDVLPSFMASKKLTKYARQQFSEALIDTTHQYHVDASGLIQEGLYEQTLVIMDYVMQQVGKANNEVDLILVYGGGSILMREYLEPEIKRFGAAVGIPVLYIPKERAVTVECLGMYEFTKSAIFNALKKRNSTK